MPDEPITTKLPRAVEIPKELAVDLASTNFGQVLTNPLYSKVIRTALGMLIAFIGTKVFKAETDSIAVQDYVELVMILFSAIGIVWFRWVSTKSIASVGQVAADLLPVIQKAATPEVRNDLLQVVRTNNPKVYEHLMLILK